MNQEMLKLSNLVKRYDGFTAVDHLSFAVFEGEVFGLLGPNGAGKTTTIRAVMDIFKPDEGDIAVLGHAPAEARAHVGYLPEERGLYRDLRVLDVLVYLAELKGTARSVAHKRALSWLERVELVEWAGNKVKDLSRGMQQKVQFVASLVHDPQLLILDEPFAGLDPINVGLLKQLIRELQQEGKTIVLSAHQMNLVEALCDRIVLLNRGQAVLYGSLSDIKEQYAPKTVRLQTDGPANLEGLPGVVRIEPRDGQVSVLTLADGSAQDVLRALVERGVVLKTFEVGTAPLEEIFISVIKEGSRE